MLNLIFCSSVSCDVYLVYLSSLSTSLKLEKVKEWEIIKYSNIPLSHYHTHTHHTTLFRN